MYLAYMPLHNNKLMVLDFQKKESLGVNLNAYVVLMLIYNNADANGIATCTLKEIGETIGLDKMTIYRIKNQLVDMGYIIEPKASGTKYQYLKCSNFKVSESVRSLISSSKSKI